MDIFKLGDKILSLLEMVFGFWNNQISLVFSMLGQSPVNFKSGGPWAVIEGIEPIFVGVGSSLVVLFFVIGFCSESVDIREEMRFEVILKMMIRVGLAKVVSWREQLLCTKRICSLKKVLLQYLSKEAVDEISKIQGVYM